MGADVFFVESKGRNAKDAFNDAVEEAKYCFGASGYTGSIAEKHSYTMISLPPNNNAYNYAEELIEKCDLRVDDKWGPAGCIKMPHEEGAREFTYLFFGWASS